MSQTTQAQQSQTVPATLQPDVQPAVIATRQRCEADGVGLSHYILMDRKPAQ